ncbi:MAG: hypothetical protein ACI9IP_000749 [Arcticibacterium sp.]|jgi:hypothetical protein
MNFRTQIELSELPFKIDRSSKVLTIGSCFSDGLGQYLTRSKINCLHNPYGIVFNPVSIFRLLSQSLDNLPVKTNYFTKNQGLWYHYDFHSKHCNQDKRHLESELNDLHQQVGEFLKKTDYIIITLGTAFAYRLFQNSYVVANCHKKEATFFKKEILSLKEIDIRFKQFYERLVQINPKVKLIFTVSPVRHIKDTLPGNSLSKSILRLASQQFTEESKNISYFPSYEILMDDLRDYRYYSEDMIHVNEVGQKYVIEHFKKTAFSKDLLDFISEWDQIRNQINHRPFQSDSEIHQKFLKKLVQRLEKLKGSVDVNNELEMVKAQLI